MGKFNYKILQIIQIINEMISNTIKIRTSTILLSLMTAIFISNNTYGQDTIFLKSSSSFIEAKIIEVNSSNLKYKKHSNIDGPTYTISKNDISKVHYQNGDIETYTDVITKTNIANIQRQTTQELIPGSRVFIKYIPTENADNINGNDATYMLTSHIIGKTSCVVVYSIDEADFVIELRVIEKSLGYRRAKITLKHILSNKIVLETKWEKGSPSALNGYSGSRAAIGKTVKKYLLLEFPKIAI